MSVVAGDTHLPNEGFVTFLWNTSYTTSFSMFLHPSNTAIMNHQSGFILHLMPEMIYHF